MLMPKKVKYRKQQKGKRRGKAWRGSDVTFGEFGLKAMEAGWISERQIEAGRARHSSHDVIQHLPDAAGVAVAVLNQ